MFQKLNPGQFPIRRRGDNDSLFVRHQQSMPLHVELPNGERAETGYLDVANNPTFDLYKLCQNFGNHTTLNILEILYVDLGDNLCVHNTGKLSPIDLKDPAYSNGKVTVGFVTKLVGLRWGINLELDIKSGELVTHIDRESPILGIRVRFD